MEYRIWCDESVKQGKYFSNFYGGVLVRSPDIRLVEATIENVCRRLHFHDEIKWQRVTSQYLPKCVELMDAFFDLIEADLVKVRIMFTQNANRAVNLNARQRSEEYFILYYHFFKHAFGLQYSNPTDETIHIRAYFDELPDTLDKRQTFE